MCGIRILLNICPSEVVDMDPDIDEFDEDFEIPEDLEPHRLIA